MAKKSDNVSAVAKLLSLGVVDEEVAASLIQQGIIMAAQAANEGDTKTYQSMMNTLLQFARLEMDERHKLLDKVVPDAMLTLNGQPVSSEQLWQAMFHDKQQAITVDAGGK